MSRSTKKGPFVDEKLMKKISKAKSGGGRNTVINTWSRASTINIFAPKDSNKPDFLPGLTAAKNSKFLPEITLDKAKPVLPVAPNKTIDDKRLLPESVLQRRRRCLFSGIIFQT